MADASVAAVPPTGASPADAPGIPWRLKSMVPGLPFAWPKILKDLSTPLVPITNGFMAMQKDVLDAYEKAVAGVPTAGEDLYEAATRALQSPYLREALAEAETREKTRAEMRRDAFIERGARGDPSLYGSPDSGRVYEDIARLENEVYRRFVEGDALNYMRLTCGSDVKDLNPDILSEPSKRHVPPRGPRRAGFGTREAENPRLAGQQQARPTSTSGTRTTKPDSEYLMTVDGCRRYLVDMNLRCPGVFADAAGQAMLAKALESLDPGPRCDCFERIRQCAATDADVHERLIEGIDEYLLDAVLKGGDRAALDFKTDSIITVVRRPQQPELLADLNRFTPVIYDNDGQAFSVVFSTSFDRMAVRLPPPSPDGVADPYAPLRAYVKAEEDAGRAAYFDIVPAYASQAALLEGFGARFEDIQVVLMMALHQDLQTRRPRSDWEVQPHMNAGWPGVHRVGDIATLLVGNVVAKAAFWCFWWIYIIALLFGLLPFNRVTDSIQNMLIGWGGRVRRAGQQVDPELRSGSNSNSYQPDRPGLVGSGTLTGPPVKFYLYCPGTKLGARPWIEGVQHFFTCSAGTPNTVHAAMAESAQVIQAWNVGLRVESLFRFGIDPGKAAEIVAKARFVRRQLLRQVVKWRGWPQD
ncbi:hypothetical protein DFJ74DRAFT_677723 [Hyaloraphidium curvatum]|nr:hypothetical protein DFJ74DRAFT_677723 [Hyaloraphidium curvatum]